MSPEPTRLLITSKPQIPSKLSFWGNRARGSWGSVMSTTCHGALSTFRRRILRGGSTACRILRSGTQEGPAGWSFDPSARRAMTSARPPLSLIISPCLSFCHGNAVSVRVVTHSSRRSLNSKNTLLTQRGVGPRPSRGVD